jgi:hypothetical protein
VAFKPPLNTIRSSPGKSDSDMKNGMALALPERAWIAIEAAHAHSMVIHAVRNNKRSSITTPLRVSPFSPEN